MYIHFICAHIQYIDVHIYTYIHIYIYICIHTSTANLNVPALEAQAAPPAPFWPAAAAQPPSAPACTWRASQTSSRAMSRSKWKAWLGFAGKGTMWWSSNGRYVYEYIYIYIYVYIHIYIYIYIYRCENIRYKKIEQWEDLHTYRTFYIYRYVYIRYEKIEQWDILWWSQIYPLVNVYITNWNITMLLMVHPLTVTTRALKK